MLIAAKILAFITIVVMPLYIIRFTLFGIPFTLLEVFICLTVGLTLSDCISKQKINQFFAGKISFFIILILLSAALGLVVTDDVRGGLGIYKAYFVEPILFFYALRYLLSFQQDYTFVVRGLILSASLICLLGLVQKITGHFTLAPQEMTLGRISGVYNSANAVALFIGPIIPFLAVLFIKHKVIYKKVFFLSSLLFFSLIMYWTKSRGGLVAELLSLSTLFFGFLTLRYSQVRKYWYVPLALLALLVGIFFVQINYLYAENTLSNPPVRVQNDTLQIRYATWYSTLDMLVESPKRFIFGAGLNGFPVQYEMHKLVNFPEDFQYPHNILLTFWSELGILGLVSFGGLFFYIFKRLMRLNHKSTDFFALALLGSFCFMVVHGLVDVPYFKNDLSLQFWILVALVEILVMRKVKKANI